MTGGAAAASCPLLPGERKLDFRIAGPADVCHVSYTLRAGSILIGDISALQFAFLDGSVQSCGVSESRAPQ